MVHVKLKIVIATLLAAVLGAQPLVASSATEVRHSVAEQSVAGIGKPNVAQGMPLRHSIVPNISTSPLKSRLTPSSIVGGTAAAISVAPWQVALVNMTYGSSDFDGQYCGGSIIAARWILTAAHCVEMIGYYEDLEILSGTAALDTGRYATSKHSTVADIQMHSNYDSDLITDDIALIKLNEPLEFIDGVREPIRIPAVNTSSGNVTVTGWGAMASDGSNPATSLRKSTQQILANSECEIWYDSFDLNSQMCIGVDPYDTIAACSGDSGGPAAALVGGVPTLVGLVSYGAADGCTEGYPSSFTRVHYYRDWISETMGSAVETTNSLVADFAESTTVTVQDLAAGDQELFLDDGLSQVSLGVATPTLVDGWYVSTFEISLSDPAIASLNVGSYDIYSVNADTGTTGYGTLTVSSGGLDYAAISLESSVVYPKADGYMDTVDITADVWSSAGQYAIEDLGPNSTLVIKKGTAVVKTWSLTTTGETTVTWDGKRGTRIKPGSYTVVLTAYGLNGGVERDTATITVSKKKLKWKTWKKTYTARKLFKFYISDDYYACLLGAKTLRVYTLTDDAICYGDVIMKSAWMTDYASPKLTVKLKVSKFVRGWSYGEFLVNGASGSSRYITKKKTYKWDMGYIEPVYSDYYDAYVFEPLVYAPEWTDLTLRSITIYVKYKVLK